MKLTQRKLKQLIREQMDELEAAAEAEAAEEAEAEELGSEIESGRYPYRRLTIDLFDANTTNDQIEQIVKSLRIPNGGKGKALLSAIYNLRACRDPNCDVGVDYR